MIRSKLTQIHLFLLVLVLLNGLSGEVMGWRFRIELELILGICLVVTGLILFFYYARPFRWQGLYFAYYFFGVLLTPIALLSRNMGLGMILAILAWPFVPDRVEFERDGIRLVVPKDGPWGTRCCTYQVEESCLGAFRRIYGQIETNGPVILDSLKVENQSDKIILRDDSDGYEAFWIFDK